MSETTADERFNLFMANSCVRPAGKAATVYLAEGSAGSRCGVKNG
jgi:hypothetical protein